MTAEPIVLVRDLEFPPVIVWDALVDSTLVSGWLAEAEITPEVGGQYNLTWLHRLGHPQVFGRITALTYPQLLHIDLTDAGLEFTLSEIEGGSRGTSTRLSVMVDMAIESAFTNRVRADWLTNLDQLEDLLRGHPVDWANWDRDRHEAWSRYLDGVGDSAV